MYDTFTQGELILDRDGGIKRINVSFFTKGIYVLKVITPNEVFSQQFIKK
ncbi:T9SS type A sorting domain-containing protein [bacterium]|nr:T9SS type A sorting domain-containing protein [bacterium]